MEKDDLGNAAVVLVQNLSTSRVVKLFVVFGVIIILGSLVFLASGRGWADGLLFLAAGCGVTIIGLMRAEMEALKAVSSTALQMATNLYQYHGAMVDFSQAPPVVQEAKETAFHGKKNWI